MLNHPKNVLPAVFTPTYPLTPSHTHKFSNYQLNTFDLTSLHFHKYIEIGYCIQGNGICYVDGKEIPFQAGDFQIIFPYQQHFNVNSGDTCSYWKWLDLDPYTLLMNINFTDSRINHIISKEMGIYGILSPSIYPEITKLLHSIFNEFSLDSKTPHHIELCALYTYQLILQLSRESVNLPKIIIKQNKNILRISPALDAISKSIHAGKPVVVSELSCICNISASHFRRIFINEIGLSPKDYIRRCQIQKSQNLLLTTKKSILEICQDVGFDNVSAFNRCFLAYNNVSPSNYRKNFIHQ